jgi:hypothetical protein
MDTTGDRIAAAPLPTTRTLRRRSSIPLQIWRFGQINLRMLRMVRKAHWPLALLARDSRPWCQPDRSCHAGGAGDPSPAAPEGAWAGSP